MPIYGITAGQVSIVAQIPTTAPEITGATRASTTSDSTITVGIRNKDSQPAILFARLGTGP